MGDEIKKTSANNINPKIDIYNKVETKAKELNSASIFSKLNANDYLNETAFLMTVFDTDESGNITKAEIESSKNEDYEKQLKEYNSKAPKDKQLKLESAEINKAILKREINADSKDSPEQLKETGYLPILRTAIQESLDIDIAETYKEILGQIELKKTSLKLSDLMCKPDEEMQKSLEESEKQKSLYEPLMSPEKLQEIQNSLKSSKKK